MAHTLTLNERENCILEGVLSINAYDEGMLEAQTEKGLLYIEGEGLHVTSYAESEGRLHMTGRIDMLCYRTDTEEKRGFSSLFRR